MDSIVIIGSGQAGAQTAISLRDDGFAGAITLVGDEPGWPYQRPPLSKAYLLGKTEEEDLLLRAPSLYDELGVRVISEVQASAIDPAARRVALSGGEALAYDHLVLATGARQRPLSTPGANLDGVLALRTLADARELKARLGAVRRVVVAGAGFIGLEFAAVASAQGIEVTVVEIADRPMARAVSPAMSDFFVSLHQAWGVAFRFGAAIRAVQGRGAVERVELSDGAVLDADLVLVGIGVLPNLELAQAAGVKVANGVLIDERMRTSDDAISAVGDVTCGPNRFSAIGPVRLESVQNAADQARTLAKVLSGHDAVYDAAPWFWSDQGHVKLQIAGLAAGHDQTVLRGDPASGAFSVFCFGQGRLLACESVNRPADHMAARRILQGSLPIAPEQAADESIPMKAFLAPR